MSKAKLAHKRSDYFVRVWKNVVFLNRIFPRKVIEIKLTDLSVRLSKFGFRAPPVSEISKSRLEEYTTVYTLK